MQVSWSWNQKSSRGYQLFMQKYATSVWWIKMFKIKPRKLFSLSPSFSPSQPWFLTLSREDKIFCNFQNFFPWTWRSSLVKIFESQRMNIFKRVSKQVNYNLFFFFFVTRKINRKFQNILESVTRLDFTFFFNNFIDYHMINYTRHKKSIRSLKRSRERTTTLE